jgi:two-component system cell cycle sensor histidine kinase/response regulator CckA
MQRFSNRPWRVGVLLVGVVVTLSAIELISGERSPIDLSVLSALAVATAATWVLLRRTAGTLDVAVGSREELRIRFEQQQAAARLGQLALTNVPHQELLDEATRMVAGQLRAELAAVLQLEPDGSFVFASALGWSHDGPVATGPESQGGYTLLAGEPVVMTDASCETRFEISKGMKDERIVSGLSTPIGLNGDAYGVLGVHARSLRHFSEHDASFVAAVASILASALRRHAAEAEAETTHRVLEAVIEGTSDDIFVKDLDGRFVVINASAASTLGRPVGEVLGCSLHDVLPAAMADAMVASDRLTIERDNVETYEESIPFDDGSNRVFLTTKGPYRARDGTLLGTFGIAHDITRRKEQEQALAQSEERLRLALEGADMGTWDIDLVKGTTTWSDGLRAIYGVGPDYPAGFAHVEPLIHPDDREWVTQGVTLAYATGARFEFECRLIRPDGDLRWILARSTCCRDQAGAPVRILGVSVDITSRKLAEEELLRAREERAELELRLHQSEKLEAIGRLAGGVAHDFNNLLVAIQGYGELALGRLARGDAGASDHIRASLVAAGRAAGLTKQLLAFARKQILNPEVLDLNEVVEETAGLLERVIGDRVELVTTLAEQPVIVQADRGQLGQVLMNLTVNARDAMPQGGKLTICVSTEGATGRAVLSVADEGSGSPAEIAERIFEPFFTTKGDDGTGLGLATVHGIVTQSGGEIVLDSEPGHGSTFTVFLPLCGEKPAEDEPVATDGAAHGTETLLLVEDEPTVRLVVSAMLETYGYDVIPAAGGEEAIAAFVARGVEIPLVVSDLMMRGLDGRQTLERIREQAPGTKGLLMSGYTDGIIVRSDLLHEGTGFIQKPFSGEELARRVRELLGDAPVAEPVAA